MFLYDKTNDSMENRIDRNKIAFDSSRNRKAEHEITSVYFLDF